MNHSVLRVWGISFSTSITKHIISGVLNKNSTWKLWSCLETNMRISKNGDDYLISTNITRDQDQASHASRAGWRCRRRHKPWLSFTTWIDRSVSISITLARPPNKNLGEKNLRELMRRRHGRSYQSNWSSDEHGSLWGFLKPPGPRLPRPGGEHGYRAVPVKNRTKPYKIYQNLNYFLNLFKFKKITAVFKLPYLRGKLSNRR